MTVLCFLRFWWGVNLEFDDANNRDGFKIFSQSSEQIIMTVLYFDYSIFFTYLVISFLHLLKVGLNNNNSSKSKQL